MYVCMYVCMSMHSPYLQDIVAICISVFLMLMCVYVCVCVQIGGDTYTLQEVMRRPDLVAKMTPDEKAAYTELYRQAFEELHT